MNWFNNAAKWVLWFKIRLQIGSIITNKNYQNKNKFTFFFFFTFLHMKTSVFGFSQKVSTLESFKHK